MSGRRAVPETYREFFCRRYHELTHGPEWIHVQDMELSDFVQMIANEFYESAYDQVPPAAPRLH